MWAGVGYALCAGLMWGAVFVAPVLLRAYPAPMLSAGRYLAFGLIAVPLAWLDRDGLAQLRRADWIEALKLSAVGNMLYYLCLSAAIQRSGVPLPTVIIGCLPVVIAVAANLRDAGRDGRLPWLRLLPALLLIAGGIACVNQSELAALPRGELGRYAEGALWALGAVACWTWYPLRNADWLRQHPDRDPRVWATAQGLSTLPLALASFVVVWLSMDATGSGFAMPLGPRPALFAALMLGLGLFASWLGTLCWNAASKRLPTALGGQLLVFETLAALAYGAAQRGHVPSTLTLLGVGLLIAGVAWGLRIEPEPAAAQGHSA